MIRVSLVIIALMYTTPEFCTGGPAWEDSSVVSILAGDGRILWQDAGTIVSMPFHFDSRQWLTVAGVCTGTAALMPIDESARSLAARNVSTTADDIADIGREYGREIYGFSLAGGLYAGGLAFRDRDVRITGLLLFESICFAGATTIVLKGLIGRSRPYLEEGPYRFNGFRTELDRTSLPSGHATVAFSVSSLLAARIHHPAATAGLYTLAAITALSRVYNDEHWLSDTFLGAAIGTASGLTVASLHADNGENGASFRVIPLPGGLRAELRF